MNEKDSLAILGVLLSGSSMVFYEGTEIKVSSASFFTEVLPSNPWLVGNVLDYLKTIKLSYSFVRDILNDEYGSVFYHIEWGYNSDPLPKEYNKKDLITSEHDGQIWITDEGRIGVWCEVDGFVAWLDEYQKVWIVDSREEVREKRIRFEKEFEEQFGKYIKKTIEKIIVKPSKKEKKVWQEGNPDELLNYYTRNEKLYKIKLDGLADYQKENKKGKKK